MAAQTLYLRMNQIPLLTWDMFEVDLTLGSIILDEANEISHVSNRIKLG